MTPAREHRIAAAVANMTSASDVFAAAGASGDPVAAQMALRLAHDLRRLKEIQSIEKKVDAKRVMILEYRAWCDAILEGATANVRGVASEVLPTVLVWAIDINDWPRALDLADHVIGCDVPLPARYQRTAAALVVENVSDEASKIQNTNTAFPLAVLEHVDDLTVEHDMHDQIRAKLMKAIGIELQRAAETVTGAEAIIAACERALVPLRRAHALDQRAGVKDRVKKLEKTIAAATREIEAAQAAAAKEAECVAAEEAERVAAEEAERIAAEEAERIAAEATDTEQAGTPPAA
jgi:hypothetical protein